MFARVMGGPGFSRATISNAHARYEVGVYDLMFVFCSKIVKPQSRVNQSDRYAHK
jgi:hypothetical protein